jgi:hypothetical protein
MAMVSLDLALLYLREGRASELRAIAEETHRIFVSEGVHREALSAIVLFQEAVRQDQVTAEYIREVASYLKRARRSPSLRFRPLVA